MDDDDDDDDGDGDGDGDDDAVVVFAADFVDHTKSYSILEIEIQINSIAF